MREARIKGLTFEAEQAQKKGNNDEAIDCWNSVLRLDPKNTYAYASRGRLHNLKGEFALSIADYTEALRYEPNYAYAFAQRGATQGRLGNLDAALNDLNEAVRLEPDNSSTLVSRGCTYVLKGDLRGAIADFDEAILLEPQNAYAYASRGEARARRGEFAEAIRDLDQAIRLAPNDNLYAMRSGVLIASGQLDLALHDVNEALRLNKTNVLAYLYQSACCSQKGDYQRALESSRQATRLSPDRAETWNSLAWLLATCPSEKFRDGTEAVRAGTKACEVSSWKSPAYIDTLAAAYAEAGDFDLAVKYQKQALTGNPAAQTNSGMQNRLTLYEQHQPYREVPKQNPR
jgi:tetratricopeptide (TPR) repeat protein